MLYVRTFTVSMVVVGSGIGVHIGVYTYIEYSTACTYVGINGPVTGVL